MFGRKRIKELERRVERMERERQIQNWELGSGTAEELFARLPRYIAEQIEKARTNSAPGSEGTTGLR